MHILFIEDDKISAFKALRLGFSGFVQSLRKSFFGGGCGYLVTSMLRKLKNSMDVPTEKIKTPIHMRKVLSMIFSFTIAPAKATKP